jgi:hypothetical protein
MNGQSGGFSHVAKRRVGFDHAMRRLWSYPFSQTGMESRGAE